MQPQDMNRRDVLKTLMGLTAAILAPGSVLGQITPTTQPARDKFGELLPQRKLGKSGPMVTMLGLGGAHVADFMDETTAAKTIETAIAGGIRYFDTAFSYGNGVSETRYGKYLTPKYRDSIFLVTKTTSSTAAAVQRQLDQSLARLKTDYVDLWQMHAINDPADVDRRISQGVLDYMLEAKSKGKIKHIGFTGHLNPIAHLRMLERAGEKDQPFTACQCPINVIDPAGFRSFVLDFMPKALAAGIGVLGMKSLSNGGFFGGAEGLAGTNPKLIPDRLSMADALHFVWSLPVSVLISGNHNPEMLQEKIDLARSFKGMTEQRRQELIAKVADLKGIVVEAYKSDERLQQLRNRGNNRGTTTAPAAAPRT